MLNGAFYFVSMNGAAVYNNNAGKDALAGFSASKSNSLYGGSSIQTKAVRGLAVIKS